MIVTSSWCYVRGQIPYNYYDDKYESCVITV
jgi:hypothetical protein